MINRLNRLSYQWLQRCALIALVCCCLSGVNIVCPTPVYSGDENNVIDQSHPRVRLVVGGKGLRKQVQLVKARVVPIGKLMRGQAHIQNLTDKRLSLEYKIDWYDDEGFVVGDGGIWERLAIGPRELRAVKSLGKSKNAAKMQVTVRFPGDTFIDSYSRTQ